MKIRLFLLLTFWSVLPLSIWADFNPVAWYIKEDARDTISTLSDAEAPLTVYFKANPTGFSSTDTYNYYWTVTRNNTTYTTIYKADGDAILNFTFMESGTYTIQFYASVGDYDSQAIGNALSIQIASSSLSVPNAFSPNGDGVNDIFKVKSYKSLTEFRGVIYNRWGQKLYEWSDPSSGWDGTFHGKPVKVGVYLVYIKAKGADGQEYTFKRDVNLLREYIQETN